MTQLFNAAVRGMRAQSKIDAVDWLRTFGVCAHSHERRTDDGVDNLAAVFSGVPSTGKRG
jgi:hypothetical protein